MGLPIHTIEFAAGSDAPNKGDRVIFAKKLGVSNAAGSGAGATVTVAVTGLTLPAEYSVHVSPNQDATWFVTNKSTTGFTVNLNPRLAANTLAAGTIDLAIFA